MAAHATGTEVVTLLNDLLQLDHDAVGAYGLAIEQVDDPQHRQSLIRFRGDHQRHVGDLTRLVRDHGGVPVEMPHVPTGAFKMAVQAAAAAGGGDRAVLLAFRSNEGQVREKYRRAALTEDLPAEVLSVVQRNAADEETHYTWVARALEAMGAGPDTAAGRAEAAFERVHGGAADAMEGAERGVMRGIESARRGLGGAAKPLAAVALGALGVLVLRKVLR